jgi:autotransporter-associated beta strand protein
VIVIAQAKSPNAPQYVDVIDESTGAVLSQFAPYGNTFQGGVRIATGDLTGDGVYEIVTAPGWSTVAVVNVYSLSGVLLTSFEPYGPTFTGGVQLAIADVDGDGLNDIITVPSYGPAEVKVFRNVLVGGGPTFNASLPYRDFLAFPSSFIGGAVVAAADMGSTPLAGGPFVPGLLDGKAEIVVGSNAGMKTTVKIFDVSRMTTLTPTTVATAAASFTPFSTATFSYQGGVSLSVARISASLTPDIIVGAGVVGGSKVDVWAWNSSSPTLSSLSANGTGFAAFTGPSQTAPVEVAALDTTGNGIADEILAVQGPGGTTDQINAFTITSVSPLQVSPPTQVPGTYLYPYFIDQVFGALTGSVVVTLRANGANPATLTVVAGSSDTISAPVVLDSNVTVLPAAGSQLTISAGISGTGALTIDDQGTVVLSGANCYSGGTSVSAGTLVLTNPSAIPANTCLTIGAGGTFIFDPSYIATPNDTTAASNATSVVASSDTSVATATPVAANVASSSLVLLAPRTAAVSASGSVATPSGDSRVQSSATGKTPPVAWLLQTSPPGPQTNNPSKSVPGGALETPAANQFVWSSTAKRAAGDLAWLGQAANGSDNSDRHHKMDVAILALEAVFAQYGR